MPKSPMLDRLEEEGVDFFDTLFEVLQDLQSTPKVADYYGTTKENIRYHLQRQGIVKRWVKISPEEIKTKMEELKDKEEVAAFFGVSVYYVKDVMDS